MKITESNIENLIYPNPNREIALAFTNDENIQKIDQIEKSQIDKGQTSEYVKKIEDIYLIKRNNKDFNNSCETKKVDSDGQKIEKTSSKNINFSEEQESVLELQSQVCKLLSHEKSLKFEESEKIQKNDCESCKDHLEIFRHTYAKIKIKILSEDLVLKLLAKCKNGHTYKINVLSKRIQRCRTCLKRKRDFSDKLKINNETQKNKQNAQFEDAKANLRQNFGEIFIQKSTSDFNDENIDLKLLNENFYRNNRELYRFYSQEIYITNMARNQAQDVLNLQGKNYKSNNIIDPESIEYFALFWMFKIFYMSPCMLQSLFKYFTGYQRKKLMQKLLLLVHPDKNKHGIATHVTSILVNLKTELVI